ncbi:MAG: hypothetical protein IJO56_07710 [Oscillospiraceae bacterium]|nr:hypothetical protein [Oscillospiraceae bacterium]
MAKRDMYNSSGCLDMTAYLALRNIEREERRKKQQKKQVCKPNTTAQKTTVRTVEQWFK